MLVYQTLLLSLFEKMCIDFKENTQTKKELLKKLRNSNQEELIIKNFVYEFYNVQLTNHGVTLIYKWLLCFFRKNNIRKKYDILMKLELLTNQNYCCKTCPKSITITNSQLDHIIPWVYVGDELENNLQMLCSNCNQSKNKSITFLFSTFLMNNKNSA